MTLTATKLRIHNEGPLIKGATAAGADVSVFGWNRIASGGIGGGPPIIPSYINGYYDDGTNHEVDFFPAVTDRTTVLGGSTTSFDENIYNQNAADFGFFEMIANGFGDCSQYGQNWLAIYSWLSKTFCFNNLYTRKSTNTTTRVKLYSFITSGSQQNVYLVALNGPTQGQRTTIFGPWSLIGGPTNPLTGTNYTTFYLPEHPVGGPDKVYYGLVWVCGGMYNEIVYFGGDCLYTRSTGVDVVWTLLTTQVDKDTLEP